MKAYYAVKAVILDTGKECKQLKQRLEEAGVFVIDTVFYPLDTKEAIIEALNQRFINPKDCLVLTNNEQLANLAQTLDMALAACLCEEPAKQGKNSSNGLLRSVPLLEEPEETSVWYFNQIYCHAKHIPAVILETKRCIVREMTTEDVKPLYEILKKEEVADYLTINFEREKEEENLLFYVTHVYSFFNYGYWGVFLKESGELIGRAGFLEGSYPPEVGYVITPSLWGQGLATELLQQLLLLAEQKFDSPKVLAKVQKENKASLRVLEKCGFHAMQMETTGEKEEAYEKNIQWFCHEYLKV